MQLKTIILFLALLASPTLFCQTLDHLTTDQAVLAFVRKLTPDYTKVYINPPKPVFGLENYETRIKQFGAVSYEKADFDGNSSTDLLFNGYYDDDEGNKYCRRITFVVLSYGKDSFEIKELTQGFFIHFYGARKLMINDHICIATLKTEGEFIDSAVYVSHEKIDTLNYVAGEFIERSSANMDTINKIEFCAFGGLGSFAGLKLSITDTVSQMETQETLHEQKTTIDSGGIFKSTIDWATYAKILGLLKHMDFEHLNDQYQVHWSDDIGGVLKITYNSTKVKVISDYGLIGTYGLAALQKVLVELRNSQHWKLIKHVPDDFIFCHE